MAELHHKMEQSAQICGVKGCKEPAIRSIAAKKLTGNVKDGLKSETDRRVHICKKHYKEYKSSTKDERVAESLGWER